VETEGIEPIDDEVDALVRRWVDEAAAGRVDPAARRLADLLRDPAGLAFTVGFVDRVVRPEDDRASAHSLREIAHGVPAFLPWHLRAAVRAGGLLAPVAPGVVVPIARRALRRMVRHLVIDATEDRLGPAIERLRRRGVDLNLNLLGEAVLGEAEAQRRLDGLVRLLRRDDVDYVSLKVSAAAPPHSPWAFAQAVDEIEQALLPVFELAAERGKFVNLDMEEYHDLELTLAVFMRLLDRPELVGMDAGIVLQCYLPDTLGAMMRLQEWAAARRARGGSSIKVRLVKGANLPMELVDAELHGWPVATYSSKRETDTNYKRLLDYAFTPERAANVRIGVAGHNLFDVAHAWLLAGERGVRDRVDFEMLLGMAEAQAEAVRRTVGGLRLYVPVVEPADFDAAIAYLVRRLDEGAGRDNFMSAVFDLHDQPELYDRERGRFHAAMAELDDSVPRPNRTQDRGCEEAEVAPAGTFANCPDTDPSLPANRAWGERITERIGRWDDSADDSSGIETLTTTDELDRVLATAQEAAAEWGGRPGAERAVTLRRAAAALERRRGRLLTVMATETGKTLAQGDPEVSEAVDFAAYYAELAAGLDDVDGAVARPVRLTVVTPPWNFPLSIPAGSTLSALAAGSAVVVKPAPQARRTGAAMVAALWEAGVPREVLQLVDVDEGDLGRRLISDPRVDRVVLTGAYATAELFRSFRPDLPLIAETSGKNSLVVTPHADLDLAVKDLVDSAFGHAGQKCSAASLGILVGSVATSRRFLDQLVDAVTSLRVGYPADPSAQVGPVVEPAGGKLLDALTRLGEGESWLVEPRRLDDTGRLWSPGVKTGVRRGSDFHVTECFGPVLGLMAAPDLDEAIALQNGTDYGLTAGLHSLDRDEIAHWRDRVEAGNLYVNRGITGAIVRRQPFGGWKRSTVGPGFKAGGPNALVALTDWESRPAAQVGPVLTDERRLLDAVRATSVGAAVGEEAWARLERSAGSDARFWADEVGLVRDESGLSCERDELRYLPVPVTVRLAGHDAGLSDLVDLVRIVAAGVCAGAPVTVSVARALVADLAAALERSGVIVVVEDQDAWRRTLREAGDLRVRLLGGSREDFAADSDGRVDHALFAGPAVEAGRVEMLTFVREQAISTTDHRFGMPLR